MALRRINIHVYFLSWNEIYYLFLQPRLSMICNFDILQLISRNNNIPMLKYSIYVLCHENPMLTVLSTYLLQKYNVVFRKNKCIDFVE